MAAKTPKIFKETIAERTFERTILGRTHVESGKAFLLSVYSKTGGFYKRKETLSADENKKLGELAKAIKKNKGSVRIVKVAVVLVLVAGGVVFSFFFKNPLMDRAIENALEQIFEAQVDIEAVVFQPLQGTISFSSLTIADKDEPLKNLLVMGETAIEVDIDELMMRRFVADRIVAKNVDWGTPRETSGALKRERGIDEGNGERSETLGGISLPDIDPEEMVSSELGNLKTLKKLDQLDGEVEDAISEWGGITEVSQSSVMKAGNAVDAVKGINPASVNTVDEITTLLETVQNAYADINAAQTEVQRTASGVSEQWATLQAERTNLQGIIEEDKRYIQSKLTLPEGGVKELAATIAEPYLQEALGKYYTYGRKALAIAGRLKGDKDPNEVKRGHRRGVRLTYPGTANPSFLIKELAFSKGLTAENAGYVGYLSSNQELSGKPTSIRYSHGSALDVNGLIDLRESATEALALQYSSAGSPLLIDTLPESTGLNNFVGVYGLETSFSIRNTTSSGGKATVNITEAAVEMSRTDEVSTLLNSIISDAREINVQADYSFSQDEGLKLAISSSLDAEIRNSVGNYMKGKADEYSNRAEAALMDALGERLASNEKLYDTFLDIKNGSDGYLADLQAYEAVLDAKKGELESRARDLAKEKAGGVLDSVKDKIKLPSRKN